MKNLLSKGQLSILIVLSILLLDQIIKIVVKTSMTYGDNIHITNWFYIYFIENPGMAFGMQIIPKAVQTIFRVLFAGVIIWFITLLVKSNYKRGFIVCISMILAGAIGNIIDSVFYGVIFSQSTPTEVATFVPIGHGYGDWLYGKVVDMFYFPLVEFNWPGWVPFIGGNHFIFFSPIFNLADAAISCGFILLLLFYMKSLNNSMLLAKEKCKNLINRKCSSTH